MTKITIRGDVEPNAIKQLEDCARAANAPIAAQMADGHLGYGLSIGGVLGLPDHVSPDGVGYDIGCGNKAVRTDLRAEDVPVKRVMDEIFKTIDFGVGVRRGKDIDHPVLEEIAMTELATQREMLPKARAQLGSVGGGNHYVDLFSDEDGWLWVGVHFGSRGFGHTTATEYLALAAHDERNKAPITLIPIGSEVGQSYLEAMRLAGAYAHAGRDIVVQQVLGILGAQELENIHNHHNYAWQEEHDGESLWVIRKGATPAFPGQKGFVGATMGEPSVILEGIESPAGRDLLHSTVHGAGRLMSRTEAAGKTRYRLQCSNHDCEWVAGKGEHRPADGLCPKCGNAKLRKRPVKEGAGRIDWDAARADLAEKGIELRGAAADEAPLAYKRLSDVLGYHDDTVRILHTLTPLGVAMAGPGVKADD